ncbi:mini-chromosome maintenance deficient 9, putative [Ichthyophthirius multifiliis]|uniref:DNA helicase n=1 Tax=Ichthyophthirius multifiliis TaxID=5932 RepID=G0QZ91_ICHMU|nr:mini-chromosome maintenance deficient 9, putative [Ichthyophthirius multifiliis]EGR29474.1 mini-chromosome maintenance deficient 9, putative [Ichthyophthirius multifiliis]|eukprot:XP_004030710.1 mini-chromosome maintenance deficient 9, putative [Ichthyophthirius multifiliis]
MGHIRSNYFQLKTYNSNQKKDQLVNNVKVGDDIIIQGVLIKRWKKYKNDIRPEINLSIIANSINTKTKQKPLKAQINLQIQSQLTIQNQINLKNTLIKSIFPQIFEKYDIKLAILLCLIGGVSRTEKNTYIRGQCHLLLIGEPGTGKSQILKEASKLAQRAVYTTGIASTQAGLTVGFCKDQTTGEWGMEAGALVLADKGICCIDEFNLVKKGELDSVLEAMEQQTISCCKAGINQKLNSRTTILAACNPILKGQKYDTNVDIMENTGLQSPLLSRFDLIFIVKDLVNYDADSQNCDFILRRFLLDFNGWSFDKIKNYIQIVQDQFFPEISFQAQNVIQAYYQHLRKIELLHSKTTIRTLESLIRLCQAHARMLSRDVVNLLDAVSVVVLQECSYFTGLFHDLDILDYVLLDEEKYEELECLIINNLNLQF